jgi:hypothetical protein
MKKLNGFWLALGIITLIAACQGELTDPNNPTNPNVTGDFRAKINGTQWVANRVATIVRQNGIISVTGISSSGKTLTITLTDSGAKTYTLQQTGFNFAAYLDSTVAQTSFASNYNSSSDSAGGTLTITNIDTVNKKMSGTFIFKVFNPNLAPASSVVTFTEGVFNNISYATTIQSPSSNDTFRVKINDTLFIPPTILSSAVPGLPGLPPQISVNGTTNNAPKSVGLVMPASVTAGTYTFSSFGDYTGGYIPDNNVQNNQVLDSGRIVILEHNVSAKRIRGTFECRAKSLFPGGPISRLTEGYFNVKYQ